MKPGHADVVGVVVLDMLLAAQRMHDRALERFGQLHQLVMRAGAAAAAEQRDALGAVQQLGQRLQLVGLGGTTIGAAGSSPRVRRQRALGAGSQRDVARDDDDGDAALAHGRADRVLQHARQLARVGDQLAIMAAFAEQVLRMGLLEIAAADLGRRDVRGDRQHRHAAALASNRPLIRCRLPGPQLPAQTASSPVSCGFGAGGEGRGLLVPDVDPVDGPRRRSASVRPFRLSPTTP